MIEKTRGIVVNTIKYSESSLVVKVYTEAFGMRSYLVRSVRKRNPKTPLNLFSPLSILDMVVYEKAQQGLQNVKEIKPAYHFTSIPYEMAKITIASFLNELLFRVIKEEEVNIPLFDFLYKSIITLDTLTHDYQNFHIWFMLRLSSFLGFEPSDNYLPPQNIFDMQEGRYTALNLPEALGIYPPLSGLFFQLSQSSLFDENWEIDRSQRQELLDKLLQYYEFHLPGFGEMKSLNILREVLS
ncbi:MAG: DNA repair protein RecO [Bacteroidetes bacterium 4572_77]|nr:MAG: DNA repair protein RecO [Bacteroidetes bacterium 4572_77]